MVRNVFSSMCQLRQYINLKWETPFTFYTFVSWFYLCNFENQFFFLILLAVFFLVTYDHFIRLVNKRGCNFFFFSI